MGLLGRPHTQHCRAGHERCLRPRNPLQPQTLQAQSTGELGGPEGSAQAPWDLSPQVSQVPGGI